MNFNFLTLFIVLIQVILATSCGVKSDPQPPRDTLLPSAEAQYTKFPNTEFPKDENKKLKETKNKVDQ